MDEAERNEEIARNFFATLSTGDLERIRATFHPDATWFVSAKSIPGAGNHHPRDVIVDEFLAPVRGMFEDGDPKVHVQNVFAKGDQVAIQSFSTGKMRNGKDYSNSYCWIMKIKDGLVLELHEYMDSAYVLTLVD